MKKTLVRSLLYIVLLAGIVSFASCKDDDYGAIFLSLSSEADLDFTDSVLTLSPYSAGATFHISGGDGMYVITNPDTTVIDYRYDGNVLTVIPVGLGSAELNITDRAWNRYTLQVTVAYPETTYTISRIEGVVQGAELTQSQTLAIQRDIESAPLVQAGGKYVFTYTDKEAASGIVTIYPSASTSNMLHGIFTQTEDTDQTQIHIVLTDGSTYEFILGMTSVLLPGYDDSRMETSPARVLMQDVTETYRSLYPALEKAYCVQHIPGEAL